MSEEKPGDMYRVEDDGSDRYSLWERCRGIVERGIKRIGDSGSLPISGTGRARKKPYKKIDPKNKNIKK